MTPKQVHHAVQTTGEIRRVLSQHDYEVARYMAVGIINLTSTILKERIKDPKEAFPLPWDVKTETQSTDDMLKQAKAMATAFGAVHSDKHPDDPPIGFIKKKEK